MFDIPIEDRERYHAAFSPAIFSLSIPYYPSPSTVTFEVVNDGVNHTLERPLTKRQTAEFDVSGIIQTLLDTGAKVDERPDIFTDPRLYAKYTIKAHARYTNAPNSYKTSDEAEQVEYVAVNAAPSIGESSSWAGYVNSFLTQATAIAIYDGYPVDVSYLAGDSPGIAGATPNAVNRVRLDRYLTKVSALNADGEYEPVVDARGNAIYVSDEAVFPMPLVFPPTPSSPFYVRWINRLGGIDYWMFSTRQEVGKSVKSIDSRRIYYSDSVSAAASHAPYGGKTEHTIKLGADNITSAEHELLSAIPFSPLVEYYDTENGVWLSMIPSKASAVMQTGETLHSIELSFDLPEIKMQY